MQRHAGTTLLARKSSLLRSVVASLLLAAAVGCEGDPVGPRVASPPTSLRPSFVVALEPVASIDAGTSHVCAVTTAGLVYCWGSNDDGKSTVPPGLTGVVQVSASFGHTCALKGNGTVVCWGENSSNESTVPTGLTGVVEVSAGSSFTCVRKSNGTASCWGLGLFGEATVPGGLSDVAHVSAGYTHSCAVTAAGEIDCWGSDAQGQSTIPLGVAASKEVDAGHYLHTCALQNDGAVQCWGYDNGGRTTPPSGLVGATQLSVGFDHNCVVTSTTGVACWGGNQKQQSTVPTGLTGIVQVTAGAEFTCALRSTGSVLCWGDDDTQQLDVPPNLAQAPQTISFTSTAPNPALHNGTYAVSATATSGLAVTLTSLTPAVCPLTGNTATFIDIGTCTVAATQPGNASFLVAPQATQSFSVVYHFSGFSGSISETTINGAKAGAAVPFSFSLDRDYGLDILAANSPTTVATPCDGSAPSTDVTETSTAGASGLRFNAASLMYVYTWKTEKGWTGTCRRLVLTLKDGTNHTALFLFK